MKIPSTHNYIHLYMRKETLSIKSRGMVIRYLGQFKDDFVFSRFIFSVRFVKRLDYTFALQLETMVYSDKQLNRRSFDLAHNFLCCNS